MTLHSTRGQGTQCCAQSHPGQCLQVTSMANRLTRATEAMMTRAGLLSECKVMPNCTKKEIVHVVCNSSCGSFPRQYPERPQALGFPFSRSEYAYTEVSPCRFCIKMRILCFRVDQFDLTAALWLAPLTVIGLSYSPRRLRVWLCEPKMQLFLRLSQLPLLPLRE